ncbi:MAG: DUF6504 family protein [Chloroflexota bacterium]|nr:DUF6504 family protein [Chloroflexota bacterium]
MMTRLWPEGTPVAVALSADRPAVFRWRCREIQVHGVVDQWVLHDQWWDLDALPEAAEGTGQIWRHYFQVATADGLLCVLYRDLLQDAWYLERVYD